MTWRPVTGGRQHRAHATLSKAAVCFLEVDKACEVVFSILPRFLKMLMESEVWSVLLWPGRKPHWVSFRFDSILSWTLFSRHLAT